jgi:hypothetical protein
MQAVSVAVGHAKLVSVIQELQTNKAAHIILTVTQTLVLVEYACRTAIHHHILVYLREAVFAL